MSFQEMWSRLEALEREIGNKAGAAGDSRVDALEERLGALEDRVKSLEKPSVQSQYPWASGDEIESETPKTDAKHASLNDQGGAFALPKTDDDPANLSQKQLQELARDLSPARRVKKPK